MNSGRERDGNREREREREREGGEETHRETKLDACPRCDRSHPRVREMLSKFYARQKLPSYRKPEPAVSH